MIAELIAAFPDHAALIAAYVPRWLETISGPVPGRLELVDDLAARGVPLFAITNFGAEFWGRSAPARRCSTIFATSSFRAPSG